MLSSSSHLPPPPPPPLPLSEQDLHLYGRTISLAHSFTASPSSPSSGPSPLSPTESKRLSILKYFDSTYLLDEHLFHALSSPSAFYSVPDPLRHPLLFYYAHTAVFYINKLIEEGILHERVNPLYESIFAIGVDEMSWDDLRDQSYQWRTIAIEDIKQYRTKVREVVERVINKIECSLPLSWSSPMWIILMGCEHERIHIETSSVLIRQMPLQQLHPHFHSQWPFLLCPNRRDKRESVPSNSFIYVPGGEVTVGKALSHPLYGWDCEYGHHRPLVEGFEAAQFLVSNAEFYSFVEEGGYLNEEYWENEEDKRFREFIVKQKRPHPKFWFPVEREGEGEGGKREYMYRNIANLIEMPWDWPVDVNCLEAKAFCQWKSKKYEREGVAVCVTLPTEDEWCLLRDYSYPNNEEGTNDSAYWDKAPGNINLEYYCSSCPIDSFPFLNGFYDVIGNVWQHTSTAVYPFDGFKYHPIYDDFSVPTFDGRHNIIRGGSYISTGNLSTREGRYAFRRHFYQSAGFRYIKRKTIDNINVSSYSSSPLPSDSSPLLIADPTLIPSVHEQYGALSLSSTTTASPSPYISPSVTLAYCINSLIPSSSLSPYRVCDYNALCGLLGFHLSQLNDRIDYVGINSTARVVSLCEHMQRGGDIQYTDPIQHSDATLTVSLSSVLSPSPPSFPLTRCSFVQADVRNLNPHRFSGFNCIVLYRTIDSLKEGQIEMFLSSLPSYLADGGIVVLCSPPSLLSSPIIKNTLSQCFVPNSLSSFCLPNNTISSLCWDSSSSTYIEQSLQLEIWTKK